MAKKPYAGIDAAGGNSAKDWRRLASNRQYLAPLLDGQGVPKRNVIEDSKMLVLNVFGLVHERKVIKKDGTEFRLRYQEAEIVRKNKRPRVVEVAAPAEGSFEEGLYSVDAQSFHPHKFERLEN